MPLEKDAARVTVAHALLPVCQYIGPQGDSPLLQTSSESTSSETFKCNSTMNVRNTVTSHSGHASQQNNTANYAFVTIDSVSAILHTKFH